MTHETKQSSSFPLSSQSVPGSYDEEHAQYSSSSSGEEDGEEEGGENVAGPSSSVSWMGVRRGEGGFDDVEEFEGSSDEDEEEFTVRVSGCMCWGKDWLAKWSHD